MKKFITKNRLNNLYVIVFWLIIWQFVSIILNQEILFVSPFKVLKVTFLNLKTQEFYISVLSTVIKIIAGYIIGVIIGVFFAIISYKFNILKKLIYMPIVFIKSVPVVSFIILLLFFMSSGKISVFISMLMVFPIIYLNVYEGLDNVDKSFINMALIYRVKRKNMINYIYFDAIKPFLKSAAKLSTGLAFKSGIAAEVIGLPKYGIGTMIYNSKLYLDTANLFSYTLVAVILSYFFEKIIIRLQEEILK